MDLYCRHTLGRRAIERAPLYPVRVRPRAPSSFLKRLKCCSHDETETFGHLANVSTPTFACKFHPDALDGHLLALADEDGSLVLRDCRVPLAHSSSWLVGIRAYKNAIFDLAWFPGENKLVTASGDTSLAMWDMVTYKSTAVMYFHTCSVKSVDISAASPSIIVSGGRDGRLCVWDLRYRPKSCGHHRPVGIVAHAHSQVAVSGGRRKRRRSGVSPVVRQSSCNCQSSSVTAVKFVQDHAVATSGAGDGVVKVWDVRKLGSVHNPDQACVPSHTLHTPQHCLRKTGFTCLVTDSHSSMLYALGTDSFVYGFSTGCMSQYPIQVLSGHSCSSFFVKAAISGDNRFLISGSSCGRAFIWDLEDPFSAPYVLEGHTNEVTAVDWSPRQPDLISTCSDDSDLRLWRSTPPATGHSAELHCSQVGACKMYEGTHHTKGQTLLSTLRTARQEEYHRGEENMVSPLPPPAKRPMGCIGTPQSQERATAGTAPLQTSLRNFFTTP